MKRIAILLFAFIFALSAYCQSYLQDGDRCFDNGDYACAESKYNETFKSATGKDKQIAEIKLRRAKWCVEHIKLANLAFINKNYNLAKEHCQNVLDSNPKDSYAKTQLDKCIIYLTPVSPTLSIAKLNISFAASGGNESVSITTNLSSYSINLLPTWCSVQKHSNYFVVTCNQNNGSTSRNNYFTVSAGDKSVRIYINQSVLSNKEAINLSVSNANIYFDTNGGKSESIKVFSNSSTYSVSLIPSWCDVQTSNSSFVITCNSNYNSQKRSSWFYINAGDKQVRVYINQNGLTTINKSVKYKNTKSTNLYFGIGLLKPMVFKADSKTFSNMDVGYNFTIGIVKTVGLYAKINTNFSSIVGDYTPSNLPNTYYGMTNTIYNSTFSRFGLVGGLMLKIDPIMLYVGAGKGHYYHYIKTDLYNYSDDSFAKTINLTTISHSGLETDAGLIINFNKIGLSLGVSSIEFKYMELNLGLGIRL